VFRHPPIARVTVTELSDVQEQYGILNIAATVYSVSDDSGAMELSPEARPEDYTDLMMDNWYCFLEMKTAVMGQCSLGQLTQSGNKLYLDVTLTNITWKLNKKASLVLSVSDIRGYANKSEDYSNLRTTL
jgi:hypothetical protein